MLRAPTILTTVFFCLLVPIVETADAQIAPDQTVRYLIHQDPADPQSPIRFEFELALVAVDSVENQIAWRPETIRILERNSAGDVAGVWTDDSPELSTEDGNWWVNHQGSSQPVLSEFAAPPMIAGLAIAGGFPGDDLNYSLSGSSLAGSEAGPFINTAYLSYDLARASTSEPVDGGDDEPVETDDGSP